MHFHPVRSVCIESIFGNTTITDVLSSLLMRFHDHHEFSSHAIGMPGIMRKDFLGLANEGLLVHLGQFATDHDASFGFEV